MARKAVVVGASGLVGGHCVKQLLASPEWSKVVVLVRRELPLKDAKLEQRVCDFDRLGEVRDAFAGVNDVFLCLGTTTRNAGSAENYRRIDFEYPLNAATLAAEAGASTALLVSSTGASARAPSLYLRTKHELEQALALLAIRHVHVFRPSFLKGERAEHRPLEKLSLKVLKPLESLMRGKLLGRLKPVEAGDVARAMLASARGPSRSAERPIVHESETLA